AVQIGLQAQLVPVALHINVVGVAGAVHRVVKGVVDHGVAQVAVGTGQHVGAFLGQGQGQLLAVVVIVRDGQTAPNTACVAEGIHPVFFVIINRIRQDQILAGQFFQLGG